MIIADKFQAKLTAGDKKRLERVMAHVSMSGSELMEYFIGLAEDKFPGTAKSKVSIVGAPTVDPFADPSDEEYMVAGATEIRLKTEYGAVRYWGELLDPLWWRESDFGRDTQRWDGAESVRDRAVMFPVGNCVWTVNGWSTRPWWIPAHRLRDVRNKLKAWSGVRMCVSKQLMNDWAGNGCQFHANRRVEPALRDDVQVWIEVEDLELAEACLDTQPIVCYLHPDIDRYNNEDKYRAFVDRYMAKFAREFEESFQSRVKHFA